MSHGLSLCLLCLFTITPTYQLTFFKKKKPFLLSSLDANLCSKASDKSFVSEAVQLLVPQARFDASKLQVVLMEEGINEYSEVIPRSYILSHCDFTADLTLTISSVINPDQLRGWYGKDDVVAEWKKLEGTLGLHIHCFVSGPNLMQDLAAELRYHIFSKEMPLVLEAVLHGDSALFRENPELKDASVWVYFHSSSPKYNRLECWGPIRDAVQGKPEDPFQGFLSANKGDSGRPWRKWGRPKSILQALFAFLL